MSVSARLRGLLRWVGALLLLTLPACSSIEVGEDDVFQAKPTVTPATFDVPGVRLDEVPFEAADGTPLYGWHLTQPGARGTVVFFGGNGFFLVHARGYIEALTAYPVNVFMADYRGYGRSEGTPSVDSLKADALRTLDVVTGRLGADPQATVVHGHSLGTFVALYAAEQRPVAGVVLENPVTTAEDWADHLVPWYLRLFVSLDPAPALRGDSNLERIRAVDAPLLIAAGANDVIADPAMARALEKAAPTDLWTRLLVVDEGGHNRLYEAEAYRAAYGDFLSAALDTSIAAQPPDSAGRL